MIKPSGNYDFFDDEPVECDCGCIVEAGENYHTYCLKIWDVVACEVVPISFTYCGDTECLGKLLAESTEGYAVDEEVHINTATDEADKMYDYISDREWEDNI